MELLRSAEREKRADENAESSPARKKVRLDERNENGPSAEEHSPAENLQDEVDTEMQLPPSSLSNQPIAAMDGDEPIAAASTSAIPISENTAPLSKNALKKKLKAEAWQVKKLEKRAIERENKKKRKADRRERVANGEEVEPVSTKRRKPDGESVKPFNGQVILELAFDELMYEKEVVSLNNQLAMCYNSMRFSISPIPLLCTSFSGRLATRMNTVQAKTHERWQGMSFKTESMEELIEDGTLERDKIVYLTADSNNVIEALEEGHTYVIGAIVDKNRYKNLCYDRAKKLKIAHAQLPIGKYLAEMTSRKILTVNHVYDILLRWAESKDWAAAISTVMPQRKLQEGGKKQKKKARKAENKASNGELVIEDSGSEDGEEEEQDQAASMQPLPSESQETTAPSTSKLDQSVAREREVETIKTMQADLAQLPSESVLKPVASLSKEGQAETVQTEAVDKDLNEQNN